MDVWIYDCVRINGVGQIPTDANLDDGTGI